MASHNAHEIRHNPDLALHESHEHHHAHVHHSATAEVGRKDEVVYEDGDKDQVGPDNTRVEKNGHFVPNTTFDKEMGGVTYDTEKGVTQNIREGSPYESTEAETGRGHAVRRYYMKYRAVVHLVMFLLVVSR